MSSWASSLADPKGGVAPSTTRVSNLANHLTRNARQLGDEPALIWGDAQWTWSQMDARVNALAAGMRDRFGVAKGDRILIQSQNCNQMFESMLACFRLGAVWVPANFRQTPEEVAWLAQSSGASGMIWGAEFPDHAAACDTPERNFTLVIGGTAGDDNDFDTLVQAHMGQTVPNAPVDRDDPCWFFFTSGTTGRPKASVLTHGQMAFVLLNHLNDLMPGTTHTARSLCLAPLSHGAGVHQMTQVAAGAATVLFPSGRFDPAVAWKIVQDHKISNMFTVPTIVKMLVEHESVGQYDTSSLKHMIYAGAPMYRADQKYALSVLGKVLVQYFGLGEVTGNITVLPPNEHFEDDDEMRIGSCGHPRTGIEISIQGNDGTEMPTGQQGEICVIGPAVFAGYYNNPEANTKSFRDGWFRTGDLGYVDEQGYLFITGRESDMYISGGSNIYPREIEEKILTHDDVSETAVLGVPDPVWGEVGIAVCVLRDNAGVSAETLQTWLKPKISSYKMPKRFIILDEMPKSAYGKITKKIIRETLEERGLLEQEVTS
ncbi:acyl-CoA synthetase (AMP-forming)/AMP-acid ligase II [Sulfitobacter undariae]|uniref:Acyl-CoA synthetase (AMP-forming)/AMP-acid ligase II n=1 Tax=Sulfitobacter undariae TaxID=1563671 RepID=A0A7W6ED57_9RHOB|nr:acyl-CoA synthetase [Sulfitobacter undariae]MBB3995609.1 acyl-CoA synthetase (AMP-forming)/AMP-acid ligase II [Sulfitobacter undariae]